MPYMGTSKYTDSILNIFSSIIPITKPRHPVAAKRRQFYPVHTTGTGQQPAGDSNKSRTSTPNQEQKQQNTPHSSDTMNKTPTVLQYAVKTFNRFSNFLA